MRERECVCVQNSYLTVLVDLREESGYHIPNEGHDIAEHHYDFNCHID